MTQGEYFVWLMDAVRYGRHPVPSEVIELKLLALYHCGPWDLTRVDVITAARHMIAADMLDEIRKL